ncbi:glycosyltransferase [Epilithonimonas vandammei]|uniref:glycosyltransferase n=1 Tax=Epilithonimonas vandammei TaxID=2487072 RepID=UPI00289A8EF6|nr:glycosyltransferase [Epilithonimonas vandammei]
MYQFPKISVALTIYNGEKYLQKQLDSLLKQTYLPHEIVIVDDYSTDSSIKIIDDFIQNKAGDIIIHYHKNQKNIGVISSFKKAIGICTNDFIATCDQDDIWLPNKLEDSFNSIMTLDLQKPCVVFSDLVIVDNNDKIIFDSLYKQWKIKPEKYTFKNILIDNIIIGCTAFFNKEMKKEIELMPDNIIMHDYWIAMIGFSIGEFYFLNKSTIHYRVHTSSVTSKLHEGKLKNFIKEINRYKNYLFDNFKQAKFFLVLYRNRLNQNDLKIINKFLLLENKNFLYRRIYCKMLKLKTNN